MKKILIGIFILIIQIFLYSADNEDYNIFITGKRAYYSRNYEKAKQNFETLLRTFPSSNIFKNNYGYFLVGMTYYRLEEYEKAAYYLEKAVYFSKASILMSNTKFEEILYFSERDFALGDSLIKIGEQKKGELYLKRVNYSKFYPLPSYYEKKALEILALYSQEAKDKLELKFNYDFSKIPNFSFQELNEIGDFYLSQKKYILSKDYFFNVLGQKGLSKDEKEKIIDKYLKTLILLKEYKEILTFTTSKENEYKGVFDFYRALAFYYMKDYTRALYLFENLKDKRYNEEGRYYAAGIYFALGDYTNTILNIKKIENKNIIVETMLGLSYYYLKDNTEFENITKELLQKYPNSYASMYFEFILRKDTALKNLNSIKDIIVFSDDILNTAKNLPDDFLKKADELEIEQLSEISELNDRELLKIGFEKSSFLAKKSLVNTYATTIVLERGKFYDLAFKNSASDLKGFVEYKELIRFNYPLYYQEYVDKAAKIYDVPQEMIYAIIHTCSKFNPLFVSEDSRYGLMCITYSTESFERFYEIFSPETNILEGTRIIKEYMDKFNGNKIKALIAYLYGEDYVSSLYFSYGNDVNFNSIIIPEERYLLQTLFLTYILYSRLYEF